MRILLSVFSVIFIITLNSSHFNAHFIADCYKYGAACDPNSTVPCCNIFELCREGRKGLFTCVVRDQLRKLCRNDEQCRDLPHSKCSKDKQCVCRSKNVQLNETHCAPLLGGFCWKNEICATKNAVCMDNECQCEPNYAKWSDDKCSAAKLGGICRNNEDCKSIKFAKCSVNKICSCTRNFIERNSTTCAALLKGFCSRNEDCIVDNSFCWNNYCRCKDGFFEKYNNLCELAFYSTQYCSNDNDCRNIAKYTECNSLNKCVCKKKYIGLSDSGCASIILNEHCDNDNDCAIEDSWCINNKCQCIISSNQSDNSCDALLGKICESDYNCKNIKNSVCSSEYKVCVCDEKNFALNKFACAPIIGGFCTRNKDCKFGSSHCVDNECRCLPDFKAVSATQCIKRKSLFTCDNYLDCGDPWHTKCSDDHLCICNSNNTALTNPVCLPHLGGYCWRDDQCVASNSGCFDFHCQCKPHYVAAAKNFCTPAPMDRLFKN